MPNFENAFNTVCELVKDFKENEPRYLSPQYQEAEVRHDFIDKFFKALGWDVNHEVQKNPYEQEVKVEKGVLVGKAQKRADYAFYISPEFRLPKFFVEAKKPSRSLKNADDYFQTIRYGWNSNTPVAVLTDFEEFHILDCRLKPFIDTVLDNRNHKIFHYSDYSNPEKFKKIYYLFSRDEVEKSSLEKYSESLPKAKGAAVQRGLFPTTQIAIDDDFLIYIDGVRETLAKAFRKNDKELNNEQLTEAVQRTIDRLVFIRFLEDKRIEGEYYISEFGNKGNAWREFINLCREFNDIYNGIVFKEHLIDKQDFNGPEGNEFSKICEDISHLNSPYDFNYIPIHILGSIYERFLGKIVKIQGKGVMVEEKPEVRKAGGVYYTPKYIVDYIVNNTVGVLIKDKTPEEISKMHFADIACGSGSFLIAIYDVLLNYHTKYYQENKKQAKKDGCIEIDGINTLNINQKRQILLNNIYGVDIDSQAIEVTQLSLALKMLEDETTLSVRQMELHYHKKVLPDLRQNIICGNSLIGTDILQENKLWPEEELKLNPMDFEKRFPEIMRNGGFDAIVGNPPYVRSKLLESTERNYFVDKYNSAVGTFDLYSIFLEKSFNLLKSNGLVAFINPNKYFYSDYGEGIRGIITENYSIVEIIDFHEFQVFDGITTYTTINVFSKNKKNSEFIYVKIRDNKTKKSVVENYLYKADVNDDILKTKIEFQNLSKINWVFKTVNEFSFLNRIKSESIPLINLCYKIYQGFVLTPTEVFPVSIVEEYNNYCKVKPIKKDKKVYEIEKELLIPILKSSSIFRYNYEFKNYYSVFPYKYLVNGEVEFIPEKTLSLKYPKTLNYLKEKSTYLKTREKGKWNKSINWYEYSRRQNFECQKMSKILVPGLATIARYTLGGENIFIDQGSYGIILNSETKIYEKFILGLLNSSLLDFILKSSSGTLSGGYYSYQTKYLSSLPIKLVNLNVENEKQAHDKIVSLVDKMLESKKQLHSAKTDRNRTYFENKCTDLDQAIDSEVYKLYNLTPEEIKIVEGK